MIKNKYWGPIKENLEYVSSLVKEGAKVLEIGPGQIPFSKATHFCGWTQEEKNKLNNYKIVDVAKHIFPYGDKEFDFVYCRHVIEDLWNPMHALEEISRIAKEGYIETPSPVCEMSKQVDGGSPSYKGYAHHRYIVWYDANVLNLLPKFPIVEYINFSGDNLHKILENPYQWCTFYHFNNEVKYKHYQMGREMDFVLYDQSYPKIIEKALNAGIENANHQIKKVENFKHDK